MGERLCPPNLPRSAVKKLLIGEKYADLSPVLRTFGVETLLFPDIPEVDPRLSGHVDLAVLSYKDKLYLGGRAGERAAKMLGQLGFSVELRQISGPDYPQDAAFNACVLGDRIVHNRDFSVLSGCGGLIHVRQGYAKCNICPITDCALITSDAGVARACRAEGLEVLQIQPGYIRLPGFDTGFIGGSAFLLAPDLLAFTGRLTGHPDCERIMRFLAAHQIKAVTLSNDPIVDIGSAVLLTESDD